jgi:hypothetical protein
LAVLGSWFVLALLALVVLYILRLRRQLATLAEQIRALRAHAGEPVSYRPIGDVDLTDALATATSEAEKLGLVMLGDYAEESGQAPGGRAMRWFRDREGTTFGWMGPFDVEGQRHIVVVLMSHELDRQTITTRQPRASMLSRPPFVELAQVPVASSLTEALSRHRARAKVDDSERAFIPVKTFEEVRHELDRMRDKTNAWRRAQPPDELLESDLKSLLGPQYGRLAEPLKRRLV